MLLAVSTYLFNGFYVEPKFFLLIKADEVQLSNQIKVYIMAA